MSDIPQNKLAGILASALKGGKDVLNYPGKLPESVPLLGGMGAGDLVFGQGPELAEDMSYGFGPTKGAGWATRVDPRTVDLAFAPGVGTAASLALRGGKAIPKVAAQAATSEGRRDFMKKAAGLTAGGIAAAATPDMLMQALKKAPALASKEAIPAAAVQAAKSMWTPELIKSAIPKLSINHLGGDAIHYTDELAEAIKKRYATPEEFANEQKLVKEWSEGVYDTHSPESYAAIKAEREAHPNYDPKAPDYGIGWDEYHAIENKHQPNPVRDKWREGVEWINENYPVEELDRIIKSGKHPPEWAAKGITPDQVANARFPITGPGYSRVRPEDELVNALYEHADMAVGKLDHPNTIQP